MNNTADHTAVRTNAAPRPRLGRTDWCCTLLAASLLATSGVAHAACNAGIPLTRPDSRYEAVAGTNPEGSEVRDKVTGLVWQRCVLGMAWNGSTCTGTASSLTWIAALDAARIAKASEAATGAAAAWRVPSHAELFSLAERACANPAINAIWFPAIPATLFDWTWSSSPRAGNGNYAWMVEFSYIGYDLYDDKSKAYRVRLVRSGQ